MLIVAPQPLFRPTGTPLNILQICRALTESGYTVHLATLPLGEDVVLPNLAYHRVRRIPFASRVPVGFSVAKAIYDLLLAIELIRLLRRHRFAAVHTVEEAAFFGVAIARLFRTPAVIDIDSDICAQLKEHPSPWVRALAWPAQHLRRLALRRSTCAVTVARYLTQQVRAISPSTPVFEIMDIPQEAAVRLPDRAKVEALREELGLRAKRVVAYTGNFDPRQGMELLIAAWPAVLERFPDATLLLVGGGPRSCAALQQFADALGIGASVRLPGSRPVDEMPEYMALADALVSPRIEPYVTPLKIYTYMASGRPIVATDLPTHRQVLDDRSAILIPPTADGLAAGLIRALADPAGAAQLAAEARQRVNRDHNYATFKCRIRSLYAFVRGDQPRYPGRVALEDQGTRIASGRREAGAADRRGPWRIAAPTPASQQRD